MGARTCAEWGLRLKKEVKRDPFDINFDSLDIENLANLFDALMTASTILGGVLSQPRFSRSDANFTDAGLIFENIIEALDGEMDSTIAVLTDRKAASKREQDLRARKIIEYATFCAEELSDISVLTARLAGERN